MAKPLDQPELQRRLERLKVQLVRDDRSQGAGVLVMCLDCGGELHLNAVQLAPRLRSRGCLKCSYRERRAKLIKDEATAVNQARAAGMEPLEPYPGGGRPWLCRCLGCGHEGRPRLANLKSRGTGCDWCARRVRGTKRRLNADAAAGVMLNAGLTPVTTYPGADIPWECICSGCNSHVFPTLTNARRLGRGCRVCGMYGLHLDKPAMVYLLEHHELQSMKVGVTGREVLTEPRIRRLKRRFGWSCLATTPFRTGLEALAVEQEVLRWVRRDLGLPRHLGPTETEGWTETFSADLVSPATILARIHDAHRRFSASCDEDATQALNP